MKGLILCCVVILTISYSHGASLSRNKRQVVPKEFANINIENYLKNDRAVAFQLKCIVYDGPCDRIGKYLKVTIPELLTNQCQNCDPAQRQRAGRLVQHIQQKFPKEWSDAVQKFQGGKVQKDDADRLESLLGVKLDSKLVAEATSTVAPVTVAPVTEAPSTTTAVPVAAVSVSNTAAPVPSSTAVPSTSSAPVVPVVSIEAPVEIAIVSTSAPVVVVSSSTTVAPAEVPLVAIETVSSTSAPVVASSSVAPEVSSTTVASAIVPLAAEVSSTAVPVVASSEAPSSTTVAPPTSSSVAPVA